MPKKLDPTKLALDFQYAFSSILRRTGIDPQAQLNAPLRVMLETYSKMIQLEDTPEGVRNILIPAIKLQTALRKFELQLMKALGAPEKFLCLHCNQPYAEDYKIDDRIWREAVPDQAERYAALVERGLPKRGLYLHIRCLEVRLGRRVTVADLSSAPCNNAIRYFFETRDA